MDDGDDERETDNPSPTSRFTVIIRWWHESDALDSGEERRALRGTVRDLMGRTLGSFAGVESLFGLLRRIMADKPRRPH